MASTSHSTAHAGLPSSLRVADQHPWHLKSHDIISSVNHRNLPIFLYPTDASCRPRHVAIRYFASNPSLRRRSTLQWGGVFAVGLAAMTCGPMSGGKSGHAGHAASKIKLVLNHHLLKLLPNVSHTAQAAPSWNHTAEDIISLTEDAIAKHKATDDKVGALAPEDCTFESIPLAYSETHLDAVVEPLSFYQNVSPSKELRDASNEAEVLVRDYGVESSMRLDVFQAKASAEKNIKASGQWDKLSARINILDGKRAGLALPEKERTELMALKKELSQACLEFSGVIAFTAAELKGVPRDVVSGYTKRTEGDSEVYDVTFKTPDIFPVFKFAENPETRKRAQEAHESRLAINVPLLDKALELRRKIAALLGYDTWYVNYSSFLDDLENKLRPVGLKEREILLELKKKEHEEKGYPFDGQFYLWDYSLDLDDSLVKEYFPVSVVVPTILDIYQNLLGVRFEEIKGSSKWHPEAKYSHAAVWPLLSGHTLSDGKRSYPLTAMVANLAKSTPDKPALMRHDDVVTFFHEMGHVFHGLLSNTKYARFHGTSVARDFVEAPSQMLENWCWEPKVLEQMSSHYESKKPLSPELIEKIIKRERGLLGSVEQLREKISLVKADKPAPGQGTFGHITGGYDAGYYGYVLRVSLLSVHHVQFAARYTYSLVFAADMYATVFKADPLDPSRGKKYADEILRPGGSREELDSLKAFLGRPPNSDAFLKELFGTVPSSNL
ncbi:zincin [Salix suchowensis]|nr:zincin [Salix suchowensis]